MGARGFRFRAILRGEAGTVSPGFLITVIVVGLFFTAVGSMAPGAGGHPAFERPGAKISIGLPRWMLGGGSSLPRVD